MSVVPVLNFVHPLSATEVATGWTERAALVALTSSLLVEAIESLLVRLPFRLKSIDTDNGSEFVNEVLLSYTTP